MILLKIKHFTLFYQFILTVFLCLIPVCTNAEHEFFRNDRQEGSLGNLFIYEDHIRLELFVYDYYLDTFAGGLLLNHTDPQTTIKNIEKNIEILKINLNKNIVLKFDQKIIIPEIKKIFFHEPFYYCFSFDYSYKTGEVPSSFQLIYNYEKKYDGNDKLALIVYDYSHHKSGTKVMFLHDSRKIANWTPVSLKNDVLFEIKTEFFDFKTFVLFIITLSVLFYKPVLSGLREIKL